MKRPWMKFYPSDWRAEPRLRMCSLAARGLWIDLMSYMHESIPYGHLTIQGIAPDERGIAALVSRPLAEVKKALAELEKRQVFSRTEEGTLFSRRMVRDNEKATRDQRNGRYGGNPDLVDKMGEGVNPPLKAQMPDARDQKKESDGARTDCSISSEAFSLAEGFRKAVGVDADDSQWVGLPYTAQIWITRGYERDTVLAIGAEIAARHSQKPMAYFAKAIEKRCEEIARQGANAAETANGAASVRHFEGSSHNIGSWQRSKDEFRAAHRSLKASIAGAGEAAQSSADGDGKIIRLTAST